jgi:hypothetical protein
MLFPKGVKIFGKVYTLPELQKIAREEVEDDILEFLIQDLDYICDNSLVRFYEVYRWRFCNKINEQFVDVYVRYYPDRDTIAFNGDHKKEFIHYIGYSKTKGILE